MSDLKHEVIAERWAALIRERTDSGMAIKEWCQERNIKESQYYYWLKMLRKEETGSGKLEQQCSGTKKQNPGSCPEKDMLAFCAK